MKSGHQDVRICAAELFRYWHECKSCCQQLSWVLGTCCLSFLASPTLSSTPKVGSAPKNTLYWVLQYIYQARSLDSWVIGHAVVKLIIWQGYWLWQGNGHLGWSWLQWGYKGIALPKADALSCWSLPPPHQLQNGFDCLLPFLRLLRLTDMTDVPVTAVMYGWCGVWVWDACLYAWNTNLVLYSWFHWKLDCWYICGKASLPEESVLKCGIFGSTGALLTYLAGVFSK